MSAHDQVLQLLRQLTEAEQLSVMCELIQSGPWAGYRNDAFIDALFDVEKAFVASWAELVEASGAEYAA